MAGTTGNRVTVPGGDGDHRERVTAAGPRRFRPGSGRGGADGRADTLGSRQPRAGAGPPRRRPLPQGHGAAPAHHRLLPAAAETTGTNPGRGEGQGPSPGPALCPPARRGAPAVPPGPSSPGDAQALRPRLGVRTLHRYHPPAAVGAGAGAGAEPPGPRS